MQPSKPTPIPEQKSGKAVGNPGKIATRVSAAKATIRDALRTARGEGSRGVAACATLKSADAQARWSKILRNLLGALAFLSADGEEGFQWQWCFSLVPIQTRAFD